MEVQDIKIHDWWLETFVLVQAVPSLTNTVGAPLLFTTPHCTDLTLATHPSGVPSYMFVLKRRWKGDGKGTERRWKGKGDGKGMGRGWEGKYRIRARDFIVGVYPH